MDQIKIFSPASVANVSCGFDVLGFCLDKIGDEMQVKMTDKPGIEIGEIKGQKLPKDPLKNVASIAVQSMLHDYPIKNGFKIDIDKKIKPGSGIGSSAASAAGAVFAVNELLGKPFSKKELIKYAMAGEAFASGVPHADNLAPVLLGGFTLVRDNKNLDVISLPSPPDLMVTIIHPKIELKTIHSRSILKNIPLNKAVQQWGNLGAFVSALYTNDYDLLSRSIEDKVIEPIRSMLIPKYQEVKKIVLESGALGCGISGSGPSIFALSKGKLNAKKVGDAMEIVYKVLILNLIFITHKLTKKVLKLFNK